MIHTGKVKHDGEQIECHFESSKRLRLMFFCFFLGFYNFFNLLACKLSHDYDHEMKLSVRDGKNVISVGLS